MKPINLLVGGLTLFTAQGCKAPKQVVEQSEHPNIIYVFPDQYRNQAMGFWSQDGFRDKVNFEGDPVHTPNLDAFALRYGSDTYRSATFPDEGYSTDSCFARRSEP